MTFPTMHHPQRWYWAGGSLLLIGAAIALLVILTAPPADPDPAPAPADTTDNGAPSPESRSEARRTFGRPFRDASRIDSPAAAGLDPEDRPEFFAELVEDAQPVLTGLLEQQLAANLQRDVDREVASLEESLGINREQADAIRKELLARFSTALAEDVEKVHAGTLSLEAAFRNARTRQADWPAEVRATVMPLLSPHQQARYLTSD